MFAGTDAISYDRISLPQVTNDEHSEKANKKLNAKQTTAEMSSFLARGTSQVDRSLRDVVSHWSVSTHTVSGNVSWSLRLPCQSFCTATRLVVLLQQSETVFFLQQPVKLTSLHSAPWTVTPSVYFRTWLVVFSQKLPLQLNLIIAAFSPNL